MHAKQPSMMSKLRPKSRMDASAIISSLGVAVAEAAEPAPSRAESEELVVCQALDPDKPVAWSPHFFGHLKKTASCKQSPLRQLVKWRIEDPVVHSLCNVIPSCCDPAHLVRHQSMLWIPAQLMQNVEVMRGLSSLVYVQKRPVGQMVKGPPPCNFFLTMASERPAKPFYWIPTRRDLDHWSVVSRDQAIVKVGIPYVLIDVLCRMYPAFGELYCSKFTRCGSDPQAIEDWRARSTIRLETLEEDRWAIPQKEAVVATVRTL